MKPNYLLKEFQSASLLNTLRIALSMYILSVRKIIKIVFLDSEPSPNRLAGRISRVPMKTNPFSQLEGGVVFLAGWPFAPPPSEKSSQT